MAFEGNEKSRPHLCSSANVRGGSKRPPYGGEAVDERGKNDTVLQQNDKQFVRTS